MKKSGGNERKGKKKNKVTEKKKQQKIVKIFSLIYACILVFSFFGTYPKILDEKVSILGDNASYYSLGQSISNGDGYVNYHDKKQTLHNHYPPGYPFFIGMISKFFSNDIVVVKKFNGLFLFLSIGLVFIIGYKLTRNIHIAFLAAFYSLFNYHFQFYSTVMMSELIFVFFTLLSILLLITIDFKKSVITNWKFLLLIILVTCSYYIRSSGLALVVAIMFFLLLKKKWKYWITLVISFVGLVIPWSLRSNNIGGNSYVKLLFLKNPYRPEEGGMELMDWMYRIFTNIQRYITREIPSGVFNFIKDIKYQQDIEMEEWIIGIITLFFIVFGLVRLKRDKNFILIFLICTAGILVLWPDAWVGVRFMIVIIPFFIMFIFQGISELLITLMDRVFNIKSSKVIPIAVTITFLFLISPYSGGAIKRLENQAKTPYSNNYINYFKIAKWAKKNLPDTTLICCRKPLLFSVYSEGFTSRYRFTADQEEMITSLVNNGVSHVVLDQLGYSSTYRYLSPAINKYPAKFKPILHLKNPDTFLFEFRPHKGYWGEWRPLSDTIVLKKNEVRIETIREGKGTYTWENGQVFEGTWLNNKRNGKGRLSMPGKDNGWLEGIWRNDTLSGVVILKSKDGKVIEKAIYKNNVKVGILN